ncbi:hypothetical protein TUM19329_01640 [Legionella antarctica]|uniref:Uncharacterized protein n=1 Tax=Legionella antarctica TaxID=2708020 RepID=A0A6F8T0Q4_9GAMM|nr:hypothetical protein [Legionella antarctica]BCA93803.1 hypothetical protein TUM19329_01640 [Legionella antarctica]
MTIQKSSQMKEFKQHNHPAKRHEKFTQRIIHDTTLATNDFRDKNFNLEGAWEKTREGMEALHIKDGLQSMLAAQMLSIHHLQQKSMIYANASEGIKVQQYFTNAAIKLSNCFVQQANILAKLQGVGGQKIIVERVDVHQGGQAIVGNIQGGRVKEEKK